MNVQINKVGHSFARKNSGGLQKLSIWKNTEQCMHLFPKKLKQSSENLKTKEHHICKGLEIVPVLTLPEKKIS